jgi:adenine phosphoribosyltransferase
VLAAKEAPVDPRTEIIRKHIRDIPDFPKPGIIFKDITPILSTPAAFKAAVELLLEHCRPLRLDGVVAIESRGFVFAAPLCWELGIPLHLVRKKGKLPGACDSVEYSLEYGTSILQMHRQSLQPGQRVLVVDDLLATGGTAAAAARLASMQGAEVVGCAFVIELGFLHGRQKIEPLPCFSLLSF